MDLLKRFGELGTLTKRIGDVGQLSNELGRIQKLDGIVTHDVSGNFMVNIIKSCKIEEGIVSLGGRNAEDLIKDVKLGKIDAISDVNNLLKNNGIEGLTAESIQSISSDMKVKFPDYRIEERLTRQKAAKEFLGEADYNTDWKSENAKQIVEKYAENIERKTGSDKLFIYGTTFTIAAAGLYSYLMEHGREYAGLFLIDGNKTCKLIQGSCKYKDSSSKIEPCDLNSAQNTIWPGTLCDGYEDRDKDDSECRKWNTQADHAKLSYIDPKELLPTQMLQCRPFPTIGTMLGDIVSDLPDNVTSWLDKFLSFILLYAKWGLVIGFGGLILYILWRYAINRNYRSSAVGEYESLREEQT